MGQKGDKKGGWALGENHPCPLGGSILILWDYKAGLCLVVGIFLLFFGGFVSLFSHFPLAWWAAPVHGV